MLRILSVVTLAFLCGSCKWEGAGSGVTEKEYQVGLRDVDSLVAEYESKRYWADIRRRRDGRSNAFGRDLDRIVQTIDRSFLNYSWSDPYVNYKTETGALERFGRFVVTPLAR